MVLVDRAMPENWQRASWEDLTFEHAPLSRSALIVRNANPRFGSAAGDRENRRSAWLDLFPKKEFPFGEFFEPHVSNERLERAPLSFLHGGLDGFCEVFVFAHGDERGILDQNGNHFDVLARIAMPPRVWLLACNHGDAMYRLAESLLQRGVRTVVAATGEISAPEMAILVSGWLSQSETADPAAWILANKMNSRAEGALDALTIFGEVHLDDSVAAPWNEMTWNAWASGQEDAPRLPDNDHRLFDQALPVVESGESKHDLWAVTSDWLLPQMLALAEAWDRPAMTRLRTRAIGVSRTPALWYALAHSHYRMGDYVAVARHVAAGLQVADEHSIDRSNLLQELVLLLIDMDLPDQAAKAVDLHEACACDDSMLTTEPRRKRLDWRSRIAFKKGEFERAIQFMEAKQRQNPDSTNDARELAWLLYMESWKSRSSGSMSDRSVRFALEAMSHLHGDHRLHAGHGSIEYLLRSLSCYYWVSGDASARELLTSWLPTIEAEQTAIDPGPWAFTLAYLSQAEVVGADRFSVALESLVRAGYYGEAAAFAGMASLQAEKVAFVDRFQERLRSVVSVLSPICKELGLDMGVADIAPSIIPA